MEMPEISIVVLISDSDREARKTLFSLSSAYQKSISSDEYEVIVVDNGDRSQMNILNVQTFGFNFQLIRADPLIYSQSQAINLGINASRGCLVGIISDESSLVTPGLLHFARRGVGMCPRAVVTTLGWCLGLDQRKFAIQGHYDAAREDAMLASIGWAEDGYRLFEISALEESASDGWFGPLGETCCLFLSRKTWDLLGGYEEGFGQPDAGVATRDFLTRALSLASAELVVLLGEATFRQLAIAVEEGAEAEWRDQYRALRGHAWREPQIQNRTFLGTFPQTYLLNFARSVVEPFGMSPLGEYFDRRLWCTSPLQRPSDPTIDALVKLAENELRAGRFEASAVVSRLARQRAPDEPAPQRLASIAGSGIRAGIPSTVSEADIHVARAQAHRLLAEQCFAEIEFRTALALEPDEVRAHLGLSELKMPGDHYTRWLERFHEYLQPQTYLEIGVAQGRSIALAKPPTRAIGIDPRPVITAMFLAETHLFCETSDSFFARKDLTPILAGGRIDLAFIDGLHTFQQALKDFVNVEKFSHNKGVILFHDTIPFDEITQRPDRQRKFYTGDVWKAVLCLRACRPDLDVRTISTPWSGLTMVTSLDPTFEAGDDNYADTIERLANVRFEDVEHQLKDSLNIVPNEWSLVEEQLNELGLHRPVL